jgi:hypothetical protein
MPVEPIAGMQVAKSTDDKDKTSSSGAPTNKTLVRDTSSPMRTYNDDEESHVPVDIADTQVPNSTDGRDEASSGVPIKTPARGASSPTHAYNDDEDSQVPVDIEVLKSTDDKDEASSSGMPIKTLAWGTSSPAHSFNDDVDGHMPLDVVDTQVPKSTDGKGETSSSTAPINKIAAWGTPTPTTTASASESGTSSSADARRRRPVSFVPFEAFISPVQSRGSHVKSGDTHAADPFVSPTATRSRASMGTSASACFLGSQRPKRRVSGHGRRESASTAFEAYIVRDSPKQKSGASTGTDTDTGTDIKPLSQPPRQPRFSEDSGSLSVSSPVIPDAVPVPESDIGSDGGADDANAMDVDAGDAYVDLDDGMA